MTLGEDTSPLVYWPLGPASDVKMKIHVRTEGEGVALARHLPAILRSIDPRVSTSVQPLRAVMSIALFPSQAAALMLSALGIVAWVLSVAGLYGVVAYSVSRRIPEIGIRMALGATPRSILRLLLKDGIALAVVGVAIGIAAALAGAPALDVLLAGVTPFDPVTYLSVAVALLVTAAAASYWPARKGTRLTPSNALRNE
jgi:putative ABC transport system permease protein